MPHHVVDDLVRLLVEITSIRRQVAGGGGGPPQVRVVAFREEREVVGEGGPAGGRLHGLGYPQANGLEQMSVPAPRVHLPPVVPEKRHPVLGDHPREQGQANQEPLAEDREVPDHEGVDLQVLRDVPAGLQEVEGADGGRPRVPEDDHLFSVVGQPAPRALHAAPNLAENCGRVVSLAYPLVRFFAELEVQVVSHAVRERARVFHGEHVLPDLAQRDGHTEGREGRRQRSRKGVDRGLDQMSSSEHRMIRCFGRTRRTNERNTRGVQRSISFCGWFGWSRRVV